MTPGNQTPPTSNPFKLLRQLVSGGVELAKLEVQRGRQEITENVLAYRTGVILMAIAFGFVMSMTGTPGCALCAFGTAVAW